MSLCEGEVKSWLHGFNSRKASGEGFVISERLFLETLITRKSFSLISLTGQT